MAQEKGQHQQFTYKDGELIRGGVAHTLSRFQPLTDFVLLERIGDELDKSAGGIVIPEVAQVQSNKGRVVAVGENVGDKLKPGDMVLFSKYGAEEIQLDGGDFLLLRYDEIKLKERLVIG